MKRIYQLTAALSMTSVAALGCAAVHAQAANAGAKPADSNEPAALSEIVVTAQRRSDSLEKTPLAVAAVTSAILQKKAITSEADLQTTVPGLTVRATQNANQLNYAIRGQSVESFTGSPPAVLPYFDEVQINNNASTGFYDLESVQVLKGPQGTLFGRNATGGAVLFTSVKPGNEFGGFVTLRSGDYNYRTATGAVDLPLVQDKLLVRIAGNYEHRDGFAYNLFDGSRAGDLRREDIRGTVLFKPTSTISNTLVVDYEHSGGTNAPPVAYSVYAPGDTNNGVPLASIGSVLFSPALDAAIGQPGAWDRYLAAHPGAYPGGLDAFVALQKARGPYVIDIDSDLGHKAHHILISNITTWDIAGGTTLKNVFGYGSSYANDGVDVDGTPFTIEGTGAKNQVNHAIYNDRSYSDEAQILGKELADQLNYVAGFYYSSEQSRIQQNWHIFDLSPVMPDPGATPYGALYHYKTYAPYAQGTMDLSRLVGIQGLGFTAGGRYTISKVEEEAIPGFVNYNPPSSGLPQSLSATFKKFSWQFGLQEQLNSHELLYVVSRHSFRAGGFNDNAPLLPGPAATGGAGFQPETTTDIEIGSKFQGRVAGIPVRFNVAVFKQWIYDIQRSTYGSVPGFGLVALTVNIPEAQVKGFEADGEISPTSWLNVGGNIAYTDAKFTKNQGTVLGSTVSYGPYPDTPKWAGTAYAELNFPIDGKGTIFSIRGDVYAQTKFYFSSTNDTLSPGTDLPKYALANFRVSLDKIGGSNLSLAGYVRNAFNKVYWTGGLPNGLNISVNVANPGAPRTFFLEARYKF